MSIKILIIAYQNISVLRVTVTQLFAFGFKRTDITIYDNGSSCDSKSAILSFAELIGCNVVDSPINRGWGGAINDFLTICDHYESSTILLVMAHDAYFLSVDLSEVYSFFSDPQSLFVCPAYPDPRQSHYNIFRSFYSTNSLKEGLIGIGHQTAFFANIKLLNLLRYDEEYWLYGDEYEVFARANQAGYLSWQATRTIVVNPSSDSSSDFALLAYKMNSLYTAYKMHGLKGLLVRSIVIFYSALKAWFAGDKVHALNIFNCINFALANPGLGFRSYRSNPAFHMKYPVTPLIPS
jgi:GT2 family glycosyltransferase